MAALWGLRELGYVYGIIGAAGPVEFYQEAVGAIVISESEPGIYVEGVGGARIEDEVLITDSGAELLTSFDKSIESLIISI